MTQDEIIQMARDAGLDWHAGFSVGDDEENRYECLIRMAYAAGQTDGRRGKYKRWRTDQPDCCPFCGGAPHVMTQSQRKYVMCAQCKASSKLCDTHGQAVEVWNRRAVPDGGE